MILCNTLQNLSLQKKICLDLCNRELYSINKEKILYGHWKRGYSGGKFSTPRHYQCDGCYRNSWTISRDDVLRHRESLVYGSRKPVFSWFMTYNLKSQVGQLFSTVQHFTQAFSPALTYNNVTFILHVGFLFVCQLFFVWIFVVLDYGFAAPILFVLFTTEV